MVGGGDCKVATVEVEASATGDNTATLPVTRIMNLQTGNSPATGAEDNAEKNNAANKEMELKNVRSTPAKKTSLFIIMSFIYAKLLIVICIAYVISEVVTHKLPLYYYEGFFTYLYAISILFLLYVFCFLLQESACCAKNVDGPQPLQKHPKTSAEDRKRKEKKEKKVKTDKDVDKEKEDGTKNKKDVQEKSDVEAQCPPNRQIHKRKTSQNDASHGSFFLRIGAIAFGLGTMVYNGLEFGVFFEIPPTSPCYQILQGINPVLQMIFTFMQMYFIFMNSRLNIHRFKVIARFGLMHVVATNICVWVRTLVYESIREISTYNRRRELEDAGLLAHIRGSLRNPAIPGLDRDLAELRLAVSTRYPGKVGRTLATTTLSSLNQVMLTTSRPVSREITRAGIFNTSTSTWDHSSASTNSIITNNSTITNLARISSTPTSSSVITVANNSSGLVTTLVNNLPHSLSMVSATDSITSVPSTESLSTFTNYFGDVFDSLQADGKRNIRNTLNISNILKFEKSSTGSSWINSVSGIAEALKATEETQLPSNYCGRVNIMGTIVQDASPYLFPFIIEFSLIGAAVIYVMWKHIGRHPRRPLQAEADLERRLEAMLSRRAVAMADAGNGRMDCVGASKGLFFGLLLLVGSFICLILFFVLIHHPDLGLLAIYLADVSHCSLMALSIIAIIIGFIRVQRLKFKAEDQSDLNDILLRVSGFGIFVYSVFSIIAGSLAAFTHEPNLLVMITGILAVVQVLLQLLFIADVSRRRVHLQEHDRSKPGRQIVTFLLICNVTMWVIYTFEVQKVSANPVQIDFYGYLPWALIQRVTLPLCIFHRFHSAVTLAEIWKCSYKTRLE